MDGKSRGSKLLTSALIGLLGLSVSSCMSAYKKSVGGDPHPVVVRTYFTDLQTGWQSVLESLKNQPIDVKNEESGFVQTRWIDNTEQKNFSDSFGDGDALLKAQFRFRINVNRTFYNGRPAVKVSVQKDQLVQRDVLEGWNPADTDTVEEYTLLYRIGRIIYIKMKLSRIEQQKMNKEIDDVKF
jgi:hypothetical protein